MDEDECPDCGQVHPPRPPTYNVPAIPLSCVNTQLALITGWTLVWREYLHTGWQLEVIRVTKEELLSP